jgi:uncharacterized SAM-binding protein YcdF (DUF218 family)
MRLFLSKFIPLFVLPDGITCMLLVIVVVTLRKRPRLARACAVSALFVLLIASNPAISQMLMGFLESRGRISGPLPHTDAIVVLGGGAQSDRPPRPAIQVSSATANRLLYAVKLYREGKAPVVILSGGSWARHIVPESSLMAEIIETMGVPGGALIEEPTSRNTVENALATTAIAKKLKIHRILLVTSAYHMPRALVLFRQLGIDAIPAPCDFSTDTPSTLTNYVGWEFTALVCLPSADALQRTTVALRELFGLIILSFAKFRQTLL